MLNKNSIQRSSPTKSCVLYRFVESIGGFVDMNAAKSSDVRDRATFVLTEVMKKHKKIISYPTSNDSYKSSDN